MASSESNITNIFSLKLDRDKESFPASLCLARKTLSELEKSAVDWIHPKEQAALENFTFPRRKASYLMGRYCTKKAAQQQIPSLQLRKIWIGEGVFHQPVLYLNEMKAPQISIAHTHDLGASVVFDERHPMGIDIELNDDHHLSTIISQLTFSEQSLLSNQWHCDSKIQEYPWIWTVKEALGKVLKTGLTVPMSVYEVKEISDEGEFIMSTYFNFPQYKALSFLWQEAIVSIVLPRKTTMVLSEK